MIALEVEWVEIKELIEGIVPPEDLMYRNLDIIAMAVFAEKLRDRAEYGTAYVHTPDEEKAIVRKIMDLGEGRDDRQS